MQPMIMAELIIQESGDLLGRIGVKIDASLGVTEGLEARDPNLTTHNQVQFTMKKQPRSKGKIS
jgi:hypothetical protein